MLPVPHGSALPRPQILLHPLLLTAVTFLPYVMGMSGLIYLASAVVLDGIFIAYAWALKRNYSDLLSRKTFRYSILYLSLLFAALLVDHYLPLHFV